MKAMLLLGGEGTRLRPLTLATPKPLLPVAAIPLIVYQCALLKKYGIKDIVLGVGYKSEQFSRIEQVVRNMGFNTVMSRETAPLGTGGCIRNAYKSLQGKEPFIVLGGDIVSDLSMEQMLQFHREKGAVATIAIAKVENPAAYGLVLLDREMKIQNFLNNPKPEEITTDTVNAGAYILEPGILEAIPANKNISLEKEVFPAMIGKERGLFGYVHYGYWLDLGTTGQYRKLNDDVLAGKLRLDYLPAIPRRDKTGYQGDGTLVTGAGAVVKPSVRISGNVIVGDGSFIADGCRLENTIIGNNVYVKGNTRLAGSLLGNEIIVGSNCDLSGVTLADKSVVGDYSKTG